VRLCARKPVPSCAPHAKISQFSYPIPHNDLREISARAVTGLRAQTRDGAPSIEPHTFPRGSDLHVARRTLFFALWSPAMSPYSQTLATARLDALQALVQALKDAETPDEKRRCAVAIFNAPDPCDLDDTIEFDDDSDANGENTGTDSDSATNDAEPHSDSIPTLSSTRATASPAAPSGQAVPCCNNPPTPLNAPPLATPPAREAGDPRLPTAQPLENPSTSSITPDPSLAHEM